MDFTYEQFIQDDQQYRDIQCGANHAGEDGSITTKYVGTTPNYGALSFSIQTSAVQPLDAAECYPQLPPPILNE
jgi:hypothetical protein